MRRCLLHLGMHKTGTTTIQNALALCDSRTVRVPDLGRPNHSMVLIALFADPQQRDAALRSMGSTAADLPALRSRFATQIEGGGRHVILSGEALSRQMSPAAIARLRDVLAPRFDEITAFAYVREPLSYMSSAFQQRLRSRAETLDPAALYPVYRTMFGPWEEALGRDAVHYARFDPDAFDGGDLLVDFARRARLDVPLRTTMAIRNASLGAAALSVLFAYRRARPTPARNPASLERQRAVLQHLAEFGGAAMGLPEGWGHDLLRAQADDIAWITARLDRGFAPYRPSPGAIVLGSDADLLAQARRSEPAFRDWYAARFGDAGPPGADLADLVESLVHRADRPRDPWRWTRRRVTALRAALRRGRP